MAERDDLIGPPRPVRAQGLPIEPKQKDPVQAGAGGRPPGALTVVAPSAAAPGPTGQAMTPLGAPAPAPSRAGLAAGDSREPELKPGTPPTEEAPQAAPGLQEAKPEAREARARAPAPAAGGVPGLVAEPQLPEVTMVRDLHADEMERVAPGIYNTPSGTVRRGADGSVKVLSLSPELYAAKRHFEAKVVREKFGFYPGKDDPNAPQPTVEAGSMFFNPFTGRFGIAEPGE